MSRHRDRRHNSHYKGFFSRQPGAWNVKDFVKYTFSRLDEQTKWTERSILTSWTSQLKKISACTRNQCCSKNRRMRATSLLKAYNEPGSGSDKSIAQEALQSLQAPNPQVAVNVQSMFVNSGTGNLLYAHEGDQSLPLGSGNNTANPSAERSLMRRSSDDESSDEHSEDESSNEHSDEEFDAADVAFRCSYASFKPEQKWRLPSGRTVEDVLHGAYNPKGPSSVSTSIRSWVLDLSNPKIQALFVQEEWNAIKAEVPPLPDIDPLFANSFTRFAGIQTIEQLRHVVETTSYMDGGIKYHYDLEWVDSLVRRYLILLEQQTLTVPERSERWYDTMIWAPILDMCYISIPNVILDRSELICQSYMLRKNRNRTDVSSRVKCGPRLDGILRDSQVRSHEFCAIESAPAQPGGTISTKALNDKAKLLKVQRDMLNRQAIEANHERRVVQKLQVFGISTAGLTMQVSRMFHPKGYVSLLMVHEPHTIPHDVRQLPQFLVLLAAVVRTKLAIERSIEVFRSRSSTNDVQSLLEAIRTAGDHCNSDMTLPPIADSP